MPSSMRSSVESRNAPKACPARHARVAAVERVHDRADDERDPAEEEQLSQTSAAATMFSAKPVSEIAFGVRRDSISRSRTSSRRWPAPNGARAVARLGAWVAPRLRRAYCVSVHPPHPLSAHLTFTAGGGVREAPDVGPQRASQLAPSAERPAVSRAEQRIERKWLAVTTITKAIRNGNSQSTLTSGARKQRQRPADHQRERDVHRGDRRVGVEQRASRRAGVET